MAACHGEPNSYAPPTWILKKPKVICSLTQQSQKLRRFDAESGLLPAVALRCGKQHPSIHTALFTLVSCVEASIRQDRDSCADAAARFMLLASAVPSFAERTTGVRKTKGEKGCGNTRHEPGVSRLARNGRGVSDVACASLDADSALGDYRRVFTPLNTVI